MNIVFLTSSTFAQQENKGTTISAMMDHSHLPIAVPSDAEEMSLSLSLARDAMSGYNLTLHTQRYILAAPPSDANMSELMSASIDSKSGYLVGHAHLYVNGEKIQRIYGAGVHLPQTLFKQGTNSISVTLNNHGHMYWTIEGKKVVATLYIDSSNTSKLVKHKFESFPSI